MRKWFRELDDLLRGRKTLPENLAQGRLEVRLGLFIPLAVFMGAVYGIFMGIYGVTSRDPAVYQQLLASAVKLPALFLITLVVTLPSLYVFNALLGSQLRFLETLRLLIAAIVVNVTVAASLGPILGFFTLSTTSYAFMIILNVALLGISGAVGLGFLLQVLKRMSISPPVRRTYVPPAGENADSAAPPPVIPVEVLEYPPAGARESKQIFRIWVIIYGLVGAQTGWLLRPFIGSPDLPFTWFRAREGNFFQSVWTHFQELMGAR